VRTLAFRVVGGEGRRGANRHNGPEGCFCSEQE
jgi:hypothetical protein